MKIGKSTINFNLSCKQTPSGERCTLQNVPYWKLYSRKGDCIQRYIGHKWLSDRVLTYKQIVDYLSNFPGHRVLEAYPRFSENTRNAYQYYFDKPSEEFGVTNLYTGEVVFIMQAYNANRFVYLSSDYSSSMKYYFRKKFYYKAEDGSYKYTHFAKEMLY